MMIVPVLPVNCCKAWPKHETGGRAAPMTLADALTRAHRTDAHFTAYRAPTNERRLDSGALGHAAREVIGPIVMQLAIFDVDAASSHKALGGDAAVPATDEWWLSELPKLARLREVHPDVFVYRTRGGYRPVGVLAVPIELSEPEHAPIWTRTYLSWVAYMRRVFAIVADPVGDWQRLMRLPRATRDGSLAPECRETIGDPRNVGVWDPELSDEDRAAGAKASKKKPPKERAERPAAPSPLSGAHEGVLYHALRARSAIRSQIEPGKHAIDCPRASEHSSDSDTGTILYAPGEGDVLGWIKCSHSGSGHHRFTLADWLALFTREELDAARVAAGVMAVDEAAPTEASDAPKQRKFRCTDLGNAERFAAQHACAVRYVFGLGWFIWTGARWERDEIGEVTRLAVRTVRSIYVEAAEAPDSEDRKALAKHAKDSESSGALTAMVKLAQSQAELVARAADLDANGMQANCLNGTIGLTAGALGPHRQADMITKLIPVAYDPLAACPVFEAFLARVLPSEAVRTFLQRFAGYCLTASVVEQVLVFAHGSGANGKSTLVAVLQEMFGSYAKAGAPDLLLAKKGETHPCDQADLLGARLVVCSEIEQGRSWAEVTVKQLTGGDRIKARLMRENFFEFNPTHKLFVLANHKPGVKGTDHAIWRRMRLVPFGQTISEAEKDPHLLAKLRAELPGILRWAVEGCLAWQREGLGCPAEVADATKGYREEHDTMGDYLADRCVLDPATWVSCSDLYASYVAWAEAQGEKPVSQRRMGDALTERGIERSRSGRQRRYKGVRLVTQHEPVTHRRAVFPISEADVSHEEENRELASPSVTASPVTNAPFDHATWAARRAANA